MFITKGTLKMDKENYKIISDGVFEVLKPKNFNIEKFEKPG